MADFCHDFDPGGLGCGGECSDPCFGDFTDLVEHWRTKLEPDYQVLLGICEGHGGGVYLCQHKDGTLWFEHGPGIDHTRGGIEVNVPEPVSLRSADEHRTTDRA